MLRLDLEAGLGGELATRRDLLARESAAGLDEPARRNLLPAVAAKTIERDERVRGAAGVALARAKNMSADDSLDVCNWELLPRPEVENDELVGGDSRVG